MCLLTSKGHKEASIIHKLLFSKANKGSFFFSQLHLYNRGYCYQCLTWLFPSPCAGHRKAGHFQDTWKTSINKVQFLKFPLCLDNTGSFKSWLRFRAICTAISINSRGYDARRPLLKKQRNPDGITDDHFCSMAESIGGPILIFVFFFF